MILLIAYGNNAYAKFASNLAHSIKKYCSLPITLVSDGCHEGIDMSSIDLIIPLEFKGNPCEIKINLHKITPYKKTIYMDVDMLCTSDPNLFFEEIQKDGFWIDVIRKTDENWWMKSAPLKKYGCDAVFNDVNSSVMYFEESDSDYFERLNALYNVIDKKDLKNLWGKKRLIPDEVLHSILLKKEYKELAAIHYCDNVTIKESTVFLSMYGYGIATPGSKQKYERTMQSLGIEGYKLSSIYNQKFVGK